MNHYYFDFIIILYFVCLLMGQKFSIRATKAKMTKNRTKRNIIRTCVQVLVALRKRCLLMLIPNYKK